MPILGFGLLRGALPRSLARVGIAGLPLLAFASAHGFLLEHGQQAQFCASCHVMQPVVQSVFGAGESLAARHVQRGAIPAGSACYECHRGYGVWGGWRAKLAGLEHVARAAASSVSYPLHLYRPYDVRECLGCHAQTSAFRSVEAHREPSLQIALLRGELGCTGVCHAAAHPESALQSPEAHP